MDKFYKSLWYVHSPISIPRIASQSFAILSIPIAYQSFHWECCCSCHCILSSSTWEPERSSLPLRHFIGLSWMVSSITRWWHRNVKHQQRDIPPHESETKKKDTDDCAFICWWRFFTCSYIYWQQCCMKEWTCIVQQHSHLCQNQVLRLEQYTKLVSGLQARGFVMNRQISTILGMR